MEARARQQVRAAAAALAGVLVLAAAAPAGFELYRPQYRTAAELEALAAPLVGEAGVVAADPGTGTLVLRGPPEVLEQVLSVLRALDVPPRSYEIESRVTTLRDLARLGVELEGWLQAGGLRIGRGPRSEATLTAEASRARSRTALHSTLRVLEGGVADVWTGQTVFAEIPVEGGVARLPVEHRSGLRVRPRGVADGRVEVEVQPILSGGGHGPAVSTAGAATRVRVTPGAWVAIAGIQTRGSAAAASIASAQTGERTGDLAILIRVTPVE